MTSPRFLATTHEPKTDRRGSNVDRPRPPVTLTGRCTVRSTLVVTSHPRVVRSALVLAAPLAVAVAACTGIIGLPDVPDLALADADTPDVAVLSDATTRDATSGDATTKPDADLDAGTDSGEGGTSTQATSCRGRIGPGFDDCGPGASGSCCESSLVTSTLSITFNRSFGPGVGPPSAPASVSAFRLDKYEVSVARFKAFVDYVQQNAYVPPMGSGKHSHIKDGTGKSVGLSLAEGVGYEKGWTASSFNLGAFITASTLEASDAGGHTPKSTYFATPPNDRRPVNMATWDEAYAFCIWDGGFLPTEAEWIYAAANGSTQQLWPWGNSASSSLDFAIMDFNYPLGNTKATNTVNQIAPVGVSLQGASAFGQYDLTGNLQEYVLDRNGGAYPNNPASSSCSDCTTFRDTEVIVRGGNYGDAPNGATGNTVRGQGPSDRRDYQGFRCARSPL